MSTVVVDHARDASAWGDTEGANLMKENYGETRDHIRAYLLMSSYLGLLGDVYGSGKTIAILAGILKYNPLPPKRHEDREENLSRMAS